MMDSLWGDDFKIEATPQKAKKITNKITNPSSTTTTSRVTKKSISIEEKLKNIIAEVYRILGVYKDNTVVIKTREQLTAYIDAAIKNGIIAIDTETNNSLEPVTCKLMGPCIYTPGQKNAYIPLNHINPNTLERLDWQLTEQDIYEEFCRLDNTKIIMHNGKFDYQVIKCTTGKQLKVYWDTMLAVRMLNENEKRAGLKEQYIDKIDSSIEKYSIEHLFKDVEYAIVDPEVFALYAATDAYMTYKLYEWQKKQFEKADNHKIYKLFLDVEMPVMEVAAEMELTGVSIDKEYAKRLSKKYHDKADAVQEEIDKELELLRDAIGLWRLTPEANYHPEKVNKKGEKTFGKSKSEQLTDPINLASPSQLAILLYDVLKQPAVDQDNPRGTGEDIISKMDIPLCKLVLKKRGLEKLIGTYIDKLPSCVCEKTNKLHAHFNQLGTDTGRFSSNDPNLQNIPSHEKAIRMLFKASDGCVLVGSDFSQQEPRLLSGYSQDESMIESYRQNKDLYATIAAKVYHNEYRLNLEFATNPDGSWKLDENGERIGYPEGKKRRSSVKGLLLGIMYGMGTASIASMIKGSYQDAQKIVDDFYKEFPKVKNWIDKTEEDAKTYGYVEDFWGRRRRLPDIQLPKFEIKLKDDNGTSLDFNPLIGSLGLVQKQVSPKIDKYRKLLESCRSRKDYANIKSTANKDGVIVRDNSGYISQAERQCVNARVQGGAATMSKRAMISVYKDQELKDLGFKLMIAVHDELIGECPKENSDKVAERLCNIMKVAAMPECMVPFKCDPTIESVWYETDYGDAIREQYASLIDKGLSVEAAFNELRLDRCECTDEQLRKFIGV